MKYFPLFLDINKRQCLVIGGGLVASRKVKSLLKSGAFVTLISPEVTPQLRTLADDGKISILLRKIPILQRGNIFPPLPSPSNQVYQYYMTTNK